MLEKTTTTKILMTMFKHTRHAQFSRILAESIAIFILTSTTYVTVCARDAESATRARARINHAE